jgi:Flp pilus assembly pilin Flp
MAIYRRSRGQTLSTEGAKSAPAFGTTSTARMGPVTHSYDHAAWSYSIDTGTEKPAGITHGGVEMKFSLFSSWLSARLHLGEHEERGANLVEYILLIAFIAIVVIVGVKVLGNTVSDQYSTTDSNLQ